MEVFHTKEEAEKYVNKNYFTGDYIIEETRNGNFRIIKNNKIHIFIDKKI